MTTEHIQLYHVGHWQDGIFNHLCKLPDAAYEMAPWNPVERFYKHVALNVPWRYLEENVAVCIECWRRSQILILAQVNLK